MASLFNDEFPNSFRLLDPGAGAGSLTAAVCDRLLSAPGRHQIELHLFENDPGILSVLHQTIGRCAESLRAAGHSVQYAVHEKDFILDAAPAVVGKPSLFASADFGKFYAVVMNPPYFKLSKDSIYTRVLQDVVHGQPNIYAFFLAAGAEMLRPGGRMVAITSRSFCNGLYFKEFQRWFSESMSLNRIHLFES